MFNRAELAIEIQNLRGLIFWTLNILDTEYHDFQRFSWKKYDLNDKI